MDIKRILQTLIVVIFIALVLIAGCNMLGSLEGSKEQKGIINASGRIEGDEYNAGAKVTGKVEKVLVSEGESLKKGDLIGNIYSEQLKASLNSAKKEVLVWEARVIQAENALAQAKAHTDASVRQAQANLNVNSSQLNKAEANHQLSLAELDRARVSIAQAKLEYEQAGANLKKAKANLDFNEKEYNRVNNLLKEDAIAISTFARATL